MLPPSQRNLKSLLRQALYYYDLIYFSKKDRESLLALDIKPQIQKALANKGDIIFNVF